MIKCYFSKLWGGLKDIFLKDYSNFLLSENHLRHRSIWISICHAKDPCLILTRKITWARYRVKLSVSKDFGVYLELPGKIGMWTHKRSAYSSIIWGLILLQIPGLYSTGLKVGKEIKPLNLYDYIKLCFTSLIRPFSAIVRLDFKSVKS